MMDMILYINGWRLKYYLDNRGDYEDRIRVINYQCKYNQNYTNYPMKAKISPQHDYNMGFINTKRKRMMGRYSRDNSLTARQNKQCPPPYNHSKNSSVRCKVEQNQKQYFKQLLNPTEILLLKGLIQRQAILVDVYSSLKLSQQSNIQLLQQKTNNKKKYIQQQYNQINQLRLIYQTTKKQISELKPKRSSYEKKGQLTQIKKQINHIYNRIKSEDKKGINRGGVVHYHTHHHYYNQSNNHHQLYNSNPIANYNHLNQASNKASSQKLFFRSPSNNSNHNQFKPQPNMIESPVKNITDLVKDGKFYKQTPSNQSIKYTDSWVGQLVDKKAEISLNNKFQSNDKKQIQHQTNSVKRNMNMVQSIINIQINDISQNLTKQKDSKHLIKQNHIISEQQSGYYDESNSFQNNFQAAKSNLLISDHFNHQRKAQKKVIKQETKKDLTKKLNFIHDQSKVYIEIPNSIIIGKKNSIQNHFLYGSSPIEQIQCNTSSNKSTNHMQPNINQKIDYSDIGDMEFFQNLSLNPVSQLSRPVNQKNNEEKIIKWHLENQINNQVLKKNNGRQQQQLKQIKNNLFEKQFQKNPLQPPPIIPKDIYNQNSKIK